MKKTIILSIAFAISQCLNAQISKSTKYIGGSIGFNSEKNKQSVAIDNTNKSIQIMPEFGYFIKDNLSCGVILGYGGSKYENKVYATGVNSDVSKTVAGTAGIYIRKFINVNKSFHLFGGLNLQNTNGKSTSKLTYSTGASDKVSETKVSQMSLALSGGMAFALADRWTLVGTWAPGLGYSVTKINSTSSVGSSSTTAPESTTINLGFDVNSFGNPFNVGLYFGF